MCIYLKCCRSEGNEEEKKVSFTSEIRTRKRTRADSLMMDDNNSNNSNNLCIMIMKWIIENSFSFSFSFFLIESFLIYIYIY